MKKYKKGFLAGTFDNFHVGHQWLLWSSVQRVEKLVVIVALDETVKNIKQKFPKNSQEKRLERVQNECLPSSFVRLGRNDADFFQTLREEKPDVLFLGYDQRFDKQKCQEVFPDIEIVRVDEFFPQYFKSSFFS